MREEQGEGEQWRVETRLSTWRSRPAAAAEGRGGQRGFGHRAPATSTVEVDVPASALGNSKVVTICSVASEDASRAGASAAAAPFSPARTSGATPCARQGARDRQRGLSGTVARCGAALADFACGCRMPRDGARLRPRPRRTTNTLAPSLASPGLRSWLRAECPRHSASSAAPGLCHRC